MGGSNKKNQSKMAESRDSVTGKYFRCMKVFTRLLYVYIDSVCCLYTTRTLSGQTEYCRSYLKLATTIVSLLLTLYLKINVEASWFVTCSLIGAFCLWYV